MIKFTTINKLSDMVPLNVWAENTGHDIELVLNEANGEVTAGCCGCVTSGLSDTKAALSALAERLRLKGHKVGAWEGPLPKAAE